MEMQLLAGSNFVSGHSGSNQNKVIINEAALQQLGFRNAGESVNQTVSY